MIKKKNLQITYIPSVLSFLILISFSAVNSEGPEDRPVGMFGIHLGDSYEKVAKRFMEWCPFEIKDPPPFPAPQPDGIGAGGMHSECKIPGDAQISVRFTQWRRVKAISVMMNVSPGAAIEKLEEKYGKHEGLKTAPYWRLNGNRYSIFLRFGQDIGSETFVTFDFYDNKPQPTQEYLDAIEREKDASKSKLDDAF